MAQQGWIKIHRQIKECVLWQDNEPYDRRSAWIDLILNANHEDKEIFFYGKPLFVKRGSFVTSELKLSERWGWSRHKVSDFLKVLKNSQMVDYVKDNKKTYITIVNYNVYQVAENEKGQQKDNKRTSEGQQKDTNKNDKELIKNDKKNIINNILGDSANNPLLIQAVDEFIKMRKLIKKPMTDNAISLMLTKLNKLANNDNDKIAILNQSIENSWQGIFELKGGGKVGTDIKKNSWGYKPKECNITGEQPKDLI